MAFDIRRKHHNYCDYSIQNRVFILAKFDIVVLFLPQKGKWKPPSTNE